LQAFDMPSEMPVCQMPLGMPVAGIFRNAWKCLSACMLHGFDQAFEMDLTCILPGIRKYPGRSFKCLRSCMCHQYQQAYGMPVLTPETRHVVSLKMASIMDFTRHLKWIWHAFYQAFVSTLVGH
jgi:hypothetical protein